MSLAPIISAPAPLLRCGIITREGLTIFIPSARLLGCRDAVLRSERSGDAARPLSALPRAAQRGPRALEPAARRLGTDALRRRARGDVRPAFHLGPRAALLPPP